MTQQDMTLRFDPSGCFLPDHGITPEQLEELVGPLELIRDQVVGEDMEQFRSGEIPPDKQPLDSHFYDLPECLLNQYEADREASELGRILASARRLSALADRVVVLGIGGSYMGARALMDACCHPYHNELSRGDRGGHPRLYFEGNNVDNDATQGLLQLLRSGGDFGDVDGRWGIVVISKSGGTLETAVAFRQFLNALREQAGDAGLGELVVPVTGRSGKLFELAKAIGCQEMFHVPDGVGGRFSVLSAVGLLPAAVLGIDVVALLRGAAAMNEHFRSASAAENIVLQYVATCRQMEVQRGAVIRVLSVWSKALEAVGLWYDQLLAESNGKDNRGATPLTAVNTRDLHSRAQQHQEGARDKLFTNVCVERWREDPLAVGTVGWNHDDLDRFADKELPELMRAAIAGTNEAYAEDQRPTTDLHLPACDAYALGQLFQMMMLATVVEGRLMGINPYGQPGVEAYKRNMARILTSS